MTTSGADPRDLADLRSELGHRVRELRSATDVAGDAIDRFLGRSSQYVPALPAHRAVGEQLDARLHALAEQVEVTRDALAAADRWMLTNAVLWGIDRHGEYGDASAGRLGLRSLSEAARHRRLTDGSRAELRGERWSTVHADTVDDLRRVRGQLPPQVVTVADDASRFERLRASVSNSKLGAVGRVGGRGLAVAGVAVGVADVVSGYREGDTERMVTGGLAAAAGAAMMVPCPPVQVAGAIVSGGLLVYEYRHEIGDAVGAALDVGSDLIEGAGRFLRGLF